MADEPDGLALARRLAEAVEARGPGLSVVDREVPSPTADGALASAVVHRETRLAEIYVHPDRVHLAFVEAPDAAAAAADRADLRVRPKAVRPPRTLVFVEAADEVDRAVSVLDAVATAD